MGLGKVSRILFELVSEDSQFVVGASNSLDTGFESVIVAIVLDCSHGFAQSLKFVASDHASLLLPEDMDGEDDGANVQEEGPEFPEGQRRSYEAESNSFEVQEHSSEIGPAHCLVDDHFSVSFEVVVVVFEVYLLEQVRNFLHEINMIFKKKA